MTTENQLFFIIGIVVMIALTKIFRVVLYNVIKKDSNKKSKFNLFRFFLCFVSIDYHLAYVAKQSLINVDKEDTTGNDSDNTQDLIKKYIESANIWNLYNSIFLSFVACLLVTYVKCVAVTYLFVGMLTCRIVSRTMEINVSFVKDICDRKKKSGLSKYGRIALAVKSLIEEAVMFFGIYAFLITDACVFFPALIGGLHSFTIDVFEWANVTNGTMFQLVAVWQKCCSAILVTLCIAAYLGGENNKSEKENEDSKNLNDCNDLTNIK